MHASRRALSRDGKQESGGCVENVCPQMPPKRREQPASQPASQRNLSKPLVILRKLFISCSFSAGCAPSERCGVLYLRKAYCCCNHTSNQTAVILCHSPTILQRLSTAGWKDRGWDCLKLNRFYLFFFFFWCASRAHKNLFNQSAWNTLIWLNGTGLWEKKKVVMGLINDGFSLQLILDQIYWQLGLRSSGSSYKEWIYSCPNDWTWVRLQTDSIVGGQPDHVSVCSSLADPIKSCMHLCWNIHT